MVEIKIYKPVTTDQYRYITGFIRSEAEKFEARTRINCGLKNGGLRLINNSTEQFILFCLTAGWTLLDEIKSRSIEEYEAVTTSRQSIAVPINLTAYVKTRFFSGARQLEFQEGSMPRRSNGVPTQLDNGFRTLRDIRAKLTYNKETSHTNGIKSKGFDFFLNWQTTNADGQADPKGRSGHIAHINLKYLLGPGFGFDGMSENGPQGDVFPNYAEESSAILSNHNLKKEKKKELSGILDSAAKAETTENIKKEEDQRGVKTFQDNTNYTEKDEQPPHSAAPPEKINYYRSKAVQLWNMLLIRVYLPMLLNGRVRINSEKIYGRNGFSAEMEAKSISSLEEILKEFPANQIQEAIEKQLIWLENDESRWIYTPGTYLNRDVKHGSLISAIRELLRPELPGKLNDLPIADSPEADKSKALYTRILSLGCNNIRSYTWAKWHQKYGYEYLLNAVNLFQQEVHKRRSTGAKIGSEFIGGNSQKLSRMIYYGQDRIVTVVNQNQKELRSSIRERVKSKEMIAAMKAVIAETPEVKRKLIALTPSMLGVDMSTWRKEQIQQPENLVLLAWIYLSMSKNPA